jgi:hypothetical protein
MSRHGGGADLCGISKLIVLPSMILCIVSLSVLGASGPRGPNESVGALRQSQAASALVADAREPVPGTGLQPTPNFIDFAPRNDA